MSLPSVYYKEIPRNGMSFPRAENTQSPIRVEHLQLDDTSILVRRR